MNQKQTLFFVFLFMSFVTFSFLGGCTSKKQAPKAFLKLTPGQQIYFFDYKETHFLSISKYDPLTLDQWNTQIRRIPGTHPNDALWEIVTPPEGHSLLDNRADGAYIHHLLDTLRGLRISEDPILKGPPESFGLDRPRFKLSWQSSGETYQLEFGKNVRDDAKAAYAKLFSNQKDQPAPDTLIAPVSGATLVMLSYLSDFNFLRQKQLLTWSADDIDEIEYWVGTKLKVRAERHYPNWKPKTIESKLKSWTHLRIAKFIDDPEEAVHLYQEVDRLPLYKIIFKDRRGSAMLLKVRRMGGRILAIVSTRSKNVFELYHESLKHLRY